MPSAAPTIKHTPNSAGQDVYAVKVGDLPTLYGAVMKWTFRGVAPARVQKVRFLPSDISIFPKDFSDML